MNCTIIPRELMFDPSVPGCFRPLTKQEKQKRNLPQEPPVDIFRNDPQEKLFRISRLNDDDGSLALAIDSIRHFFYGDRDKLGNALFYYHRKKSNRSFFAVRKTYFREYRSGYYNNFPFCYSEILHQYL